MAYQITSSAGIDLGIYDGANQAEALDKMAQAAGYESHAEAQAVAPCDGLTVTDVRDAVDEHVRKNFSNINFEVI
tara:strand:+ start:1013 stop:1237 length:225 start_codon:yes stop_codon:yes gene_type:complete